MIIITDYGAGNVKSIANMLEFLGADYKISSEKEEILNADAIIFPGQGHFGQAMTNLNNSSLTSVIKETALDRNIKFLGICLGLQILFETSEEAPNEKGLSVFKGTVKKFSCDKIPQIGWNNIQTTNSNSYLKDGYFYFVNSYYVVPENTDIISSYADYNGIKFCSSVEYKNITAVQFHPEKSSENGILFFKNWLNNNVIC